MALWRVRATVDDRPGFLAVLTASLALRSINILAVQVHTTEAGAVDDFLVDAPDNLSEAELIAAVERGRGRDAWATPADAHGLIDPPTQALHLAARLIADPDLLSGALGSLLGGCLVRREPGPVAAGFSELMMRLPDLAVDGSDAGTTVLTRLAPAFTPAEFARAQALIEVARAAAAARAAAGGTVVLLPDGSELVLRLAGQDDLAAIVGLHARCGQSSLFRRYLAGTRGPSEAQLARLVTPAHGCSLVAEVVTSGRGHGQVVAMANLVGEGEQAEAALLVEDAWQRQGIGTALLRRLMRMAAPTGFRAVTLHTHADNEPLLRTVRRLAMPTRFDMDSGLISATVEVSGLPAVV